MSRKESIELLDELLSCDALKDKYKEAINVAIDVMLEEEREDNKE